MTYRTGCPWNNILEAERGCESNVVSKFTGEPRDFPSQKGINFPPVVGYY